jgi:hypothetical protein
LQLGSVNGFVNIGGFLASFIMMAIVGLVLDWNNHGQSQSLLFSLENFKFAIPFHFAVTIIGLMFYLRELKGTKAVEGMKE